MTQRDSLAKNSIEFVEGLKRRWMATVDAIVDPLILIDKDYRILQSNRAMAKLSNRDVKTLVGSRCFEVFAERQSPCPHCPLQESLQKKQNLTFELPKIRGERTYEVTTQPIYDAHGELEGSLHIYRDRTDAKRMELQLLQHEKLASIGLLAGGIAHELNNPLAGILLFSQMLLRSLPKDGEHYPDVVEIEAAANRCKQIVESLLDFARMQPVQEDKSRNETVDLREVLQSALRFCRVGGAADAVDVQFEWETDARVEANRNKLIQVFLNLIQNALQAMPEGGTLRLRTTVETSADGQSFAVAHIQDTGVGIPATDLKRIFDPFFTSKAEGEGTGLGLSICHGIVHDLGGNIAVTSQLQKGSCFSVSLPMSKAQLKTGS